MTNKAAEQLRKAWQTDARWQGISRTYTAEDVVRLRGSVQVEHTWDPLESTCRHASLSIL